MASATDLFESMMMNEIADAQHSYSNQSYLLDQTIDKAAELLAKSAEPFKKKLTILLPLRQRSMPWSLIFQHQNQNTIRI